MLTPDRRNHPVPQSKQTHEARLRACERRAVNSGDEGLGQLLRREVVGPAAEAAEGDGGKEDECEEGGWWEGRSGRGKVCREGEGPEGEAGGDLRV
jgi:hypothetical protein